MVGRQAAADVVGAGGVPVTAGGAVDVGVAAAEVTPVVALAGGEPDESEGEQAESAAKAARAVTRMLVRRRAVPPGSWITRPGGWRASSCQWNGMVAR